jgi:hypothetical protein
MEEKSRSFVIPSPGEHGPPVNPADYRHRNIDEDFR